ncbi:MAG: glycosyltransferase family 2 protein [Candidatus Levyibacteriota bacterium]
MAIKNNTRKVPLLSLSFNVYNEAANVERTYKECKNILIKAKIPYEIILVEGGSKDNSWKVLQALAKKNKDCRVFQTKMEPGRKVNKGMREARGKYFGYMCSDGQDNPNVLPKFIKLLESNKADFVKARRVNRIFWERKVISRVYNRLSDLLFGLGLSDINMHPKVFRRELVKGINLISVGESIDLEVVLRAQKKGYRIVEIPVRERVRGGGKSSVNPSVALHMLTDMLSYKWGRKSKMLNRNISGEKPSRKGSIAS